VKILCTVCDSETENSVVRDNSIKRKLKLNQTNCFLFLTAYDLLSFTFVNKNPFTHPSLPQHLSLETPPATAK
jgi:hypothetical protein